MVNVTDVEMSTEELTLPANTISTVTFTTDVDTVEVISNGAAKLRWTCDGSDPSETHGWYVPALAMVDTRSVPASGKTVVKVWTNGTPTVVVQCDT